MEKAQVSNWFFAFVISTFAFLESHIQPRNGTENEKEIYGNRYAGVYPN